ncbi:MAG: GGDEF domain-containing protein [Variovorax paradoxus]|uniref:diguanylate cyclase n=1 Tax=Variovorax paradoxus TaxID=34073 RepID=A0A2W5RJ16_VARPD|nr:MAG: GGDEF domain-containing protein [Variovorax paradoxus]
MGSLPTVIDPRSIILLAGIMGIVMAVVVFFMRRSYPPSIRGLREWAWAPLVAFASTMLFSGRGVLPDLLTVVLANMVLFQACILYYAGSQQFLLGHSHTGGWTLVNLAMGLVLAWFTLVRPDYEARLLVVTLLVTLLFLSHAGLYVRHRGRVFGMALMTGLLLLQALVAGLRFVSAVFGLAGSDLMEATWIQSLYITMYSLTVLLLSIAAILMATDRVHTEFEYLASRDPLTGVLNRRALLDACEAEAKRLPRAGGRSMALLMIDVDHFKRINDRFGHQQGDAVLREAVRRMQQASGEAGVLGRYGGEEFALLLPGADVQAALDHADRLRHAVAAPFEPGSPLQPIGPVSVSIGVAAVSEQASVDALFAGADAALYRAKAQGRDRVVAA